ncbi:phosphodiesterase [Corynebacterium epidermidicanis]|uniref:Calcineurin-like phosphoesterase n=1 Tax=Corynebacterium epidermidicanis TaxID=1050174 RepID=A0A0G3GT58_9CORY|nr:phosphodiesterase [Corynebacterium epidermidicanis]AKK03725.1 Calcineurin-like phosphoesterase [Corynebacterium epidermidicanis]
MYTFSDSERGLPDHFFIHISDTHFAVEKGEKLHGVAAYREHLSKLLEAVEAMEVRPEALIFSGDLTDFGTPESYLALRELVEPVAQRIGAQILWAMGNHDDRSNFRSILLRTDPHSASCDSVYNFGGLRVVVADSTVPGHHHGEFSTAQLTWLAEVLREPAPEGTLLVMHHPPVPCIQEAAISVELRGQHELSELLAGTDVRAILAGHLHYSTFATFAGIPVSVATSSCYTQDLFTPMHGTRGRDEFQGLNFVHVYPDTVMHTCVPMPGGETVGRLIPGRPI